jgi:uncharacterized iron-regulated protein
VGKYFLILFSLNLFAFGASASQPLAVRPLSLSEIVGDERVIYFGESHWDSAPKIYLASKMRELKELGITHIILEMFNYDSQKLLDGYAAGKISDLEIINYLNANWGWIPQRHLQILNAARAAGIKTIALDKREQNVVSRYEQAKAQGERPDSNLGRNEKDDLHMANVVAATIKASPRNRVVVLIGVSHIDFRQGIWGVQYQPGILRTVHNIASKSYSILPLNYAAWTFRPHNSMAILNTI